MNTPQTGLRVAAVAFAIFALAHLWRLFRHINVRIGDFHVPIWFSGVAFVLAAAVSIWLWTLSKR